MLLGGKNEKEKAFLQVFSLEAGCLVLQVAKEYCMEWKKVIFQGGSIIFSQKTLHEPPPSIGPAESSEFLLEALTLAEAQKVSSPHAPCSENSLLSQSSLGNALLWWDPSPFPHPSHKKTLCTETRTSANRAHHSTRS